MTKSKKKKSAREMDRGYWDNMAKGYEQEIFSVFHSDAEGLITRRLKTIAKECKTVADVGCGIGHFLPILSKTFTRVYANDISPDLLARAERDHGPRGNITFLAGDIRAAFRKLPRVDCVVSVNSLISSSAAIRRLMLVAMAKILKPGGTMVLVVPSLESSLLAQFRLWQWYVKGGASTAKAFREVYAKDAEADHLSRQGVVLIDGVLTKHFFKEELEALLDEVGCEGCEYVKIPYSWDTEFAEPPKWMKAPYPWDWLVVARKRKI